MSKLTQEAIAFQSSAFFDELTRAITAIRAHSTLARDPDWWMHESAQALEATVKKHTNLKMQLRSTDYPYPMVSFYTPKNSHVFSNLSGASGESITAVLSKNKQLITGGVDLIKAKVSGVYNDFVSTLIYPQAVMFGTHLSDVEVAATIAHEIGHVFTAFEYASRLYTTNVFLSAVARQLDGSSTDRATDLYVAYREQLGATQADVDALANAKSQEEASVLVMGRSQEFCASELGSSVFDENGAEALADQFAARLGAGRHLVTGLDKLLRSNALWDQKNNGALYSAFTLVILSAALATPLALAISLPSLALHVLLHGKDQTYGSTKMRFERVIQQNIQRLKERSISDAEKKALLQDNQTIELVLKKYNEGGSLVSFLAYVFRKDYRKTHDQEQLQRELEKLAHSKLFSFSARLSLK